MPVFDAIGDIWTRYVFYHAGGLQDGMIGIQGKVVTYIVSSVVKVSKMISFNAFGVSSVEGIVRNFNSQKFAVDQACCQRVG